ncbi:MAG: hypothetical protein JO147_14640 [Actinobacteria bacterium]|nr:hypothetical protein [Actinomycetota bacterium]
MTSSPTPVTITVTVTNNGTSTLAQLSLVGAREAPIVTQKALDAALARPTRGTSLLTSLTVEPIEGTLAPHQTRTLSYTVQTSTTNDRGIACFCQAGGGVYPIDIALHTGGATGGPGVAWAQALLPYVPADRSLRTGWIWPLIDRPHRLTEDNVFLDDTLTGSVSSGGRLDRALDVLESVGASAHLSVVLDPELVDELVTMTHGYRVQSVTGLVAGTGAAAAAHWLARLGQVLGTLPPADVSLLPFADPDVDAVTRAGLTYTSTMPEPMRTQVDTALGRAYGSKLAWPAGETATASGLAALLAAGASGVVLDDQTLPPPDDEPDAAAIAPLPGSSTTRAVVVDDNLDKRATSALTAGGSGVTGLSQLAAELAMRAITADGSGYVAFVPDRRVDADPSAAAATIRTSSLQAWTAPTSAAEALVAVAPVERGSLRTPSSAQPAEISPAQLDTVRSAGTFVTGFRTVVAPTDAATLFVGYPAAFQRLESSAWRADRQTGQSYANRLNGDIAALSGGVHIVRPTNGTYSLDSNTGKLPLTVRNDLPYTVTVRIRANSDLVGFSTDDAGAQTIGPQSQHIVYLPAHVARTGHFKITAALLAPDGLPLGAGVPLSIYSTALGTIGVVITVVAVVVLVLALVVRFGRRLYRRGRPSPSPAHDLAGV